MVADGCDMFAVGGLRLLSCDELAQEARGEYRQLLGAAQAATGKLKGKPCPAHFPVALTGDSMGLFTMDGATGQVHWTSLHDGCLGLGPHWKDLRSFLSDIVQVIQSKKWHPGGDGMETVLLDHGSSVLVPATW